MLLEFRVANFRSFNEEQVLSMAAAPRLKKKENTITLKLKGDPVPPLLKSIAIYGPNASGKSNFVAALAFVRRLVTQAAGRERLTERADAFRFVKAKAPSKFELHFVHEKQRYEFGLWVIPGRIVKEWLVGYPAGEASLLYKRVFSEASASDEYEYGNGLEGDKNLHELWSQITTPTDLYLSKAVANSSEKLSQLRTVFEWFSKTLLVFPRSRFSNLEHVANEILHKHPLFAEAISSFLTNLDIPTKSIRIEERSEYHNLQESIAESGDARPTLESILSLGDLEAIRWSASFTHENSGISATFDLLDESDGTRALYGFAVPWFLAGPSQRVLIFDELDTSLHPLIIEQLILQHHKKDNTQLLFTTHDTHLMDSKVLRRDQFWFTQRDRLGATRLSSIYDYEGREGEDIEKRYFEGRYRALPIIRTKSLKDQ
jgi:AAA15 family ATPase/GTPase